MPEYLRVKDNQTKHEFSIVASALVTYGDAVTVLDKPAARPDGTPLPTKHHKSLSGLSAPKSSAPEESTSGRKAKSAQK